MTELPAEWYKEEHGDSFFSTPIINTGVLYSSFSYSKLTLSSQNIEVFSGEPNLTFFRRSDSIETGTLNRYDAAGMYQKLLGVSVEESVKLAKFVQGYAYAYQVLGSLRPAGYRI